MTLYNCTAHNNGGNNFSISEPLDPGKTLTLTNCVELGNKVSLGAFAILASDSWITPFGGATSADFTSIDTTGVRAPRNADGSLPEINYMQLVHGSRFIDAGTNVGLPYFGDAPDLGAFESNYPLGVASTTLTPAAFTLAQNYPNPFNPSTQIRFSLDKASWTTLDVFNLLGQHIAMLYDGVAAPGKFYTVTFHADNLPTGVYFYRLRSDNRMQLKKLLLLK